MPSISAVIAVYNSEASLQELYDQLIPVMEKLTSDFEIIMVEDCGHDRSWEIVRELAERDARVRAIQLRKNYGQHNALLCGIRAARCEVVVTLDDDLQHPPSEIPVLIDKLSEGFDVVYGAPSKLRHGLFRNLASWTTKRVLQGVMGAEIARNVSSFRAMQTVLRDAFASYGGSSVSVDVLLSWATSRFAVVKVGHQPRTLGKSNYTFRKLLTHTLNMMTGFSTLPLQVASFMGFFFTLFGFGILVWVVARYAVMGTSVPGFPFLASIIAIFAGAQLFSLGVFGEYLGRVHFRTMDRPTYFVRQSLNFSPTKPETKETTESLPVDDSDHETS